jgi:hypothetical protein
VPEFDFSNYAAEKEELGITLMDGERIVLPKILDTYTVMEVVGNMTREEAQELPEGEKKRFGLEILKAILGEENTKKFVNGVPRDRQEQIAKAILTYYGLIGEGAEDGGKAEETPEAAPPPSPTRRSTTTSDTSTPTSSDSTPQVGDDSTEDASTSGSSLEGLAPSPLSRSS